MHVKRNDRKDVPRTGTNKKHLEYLCSEFWDWAKLFLKKSSTYTHYLLLTNLTLSDVIAPKKSSKIHRYQTNKL